MLTRTAPDGVWYVKDGSGNGKDGIVSIDLIRTFHKRGRSFGLMNQLTFQDAIGASPVCFSSKEMAERFLKEQFPDSYELNPTPAVDGYSVYGLHLENLTEEQRQLLVERYTYEAYKHWNLVMPFSREGAQKPGRYAHAQMFAYLDQLEIALTNDIKDDYIRGMEEDFPELIINHVSDVEKAGRIGVNKAYVEKANSSGGLTHPGVALIKIPIDDSFVDGGISLELLKRFSEGHPDKYAAIAKLAPDYFPEDAKNLQVSRYRGFDF